MTRRRVYLDASFVVVLLDPTDGRHSAAHAAFEQLLVEFERGTTLLYSHEAMVDDVAGQRVVDLLAACDVARQRPWLTREAGRVQRNHPELGVGRATTLVLMSQWRIGEIASFDPFFEQHGIATVEVPSGRAS